MTEALEMYAVYENPRDFPGEFIVRRWLIAGREPQPDAEPWMRAKSLEDARESIPIGSFNLGRYANDDPCIVETWI